MIDTKEHLLEKIASVGLLNAGLSTNLQFV